MSETTNKIVYDLLQFRRVPAESTIVFASWKHDADLCPRLQQQIETAYSAIEKYQTITYDIQGPRDAGSDIILREPSDGDHEYVCFQIKSHNDLKESDYLKTLKAQVFDSQSRYGEHLNDYYILLCSSLVTYDVKKNQLVNDKSVKAKIRLISGEFTPAPNVHVIEPEYALAFLRLASTQIDAVVKRRLSEADVVQREAMELVLDLTPTETALLIFIIWAQIENNRPFATLEEIKNSDFVRQVYEDMPDLERDAFFFFKEDIVDRESREIYQSLQLPRGLDFETRVIYDLEFLDGELIEDLDTQRYSVNLKRVEPIAVTVMDGRIRFDYDGKTLLDYVINVVRSDFNTEST